jgi:hypothetical protein
LTRHVGEDRRRRGSDLVEVSSCYSDVHGADYLGPLEEVLELLCRVRRLNALIDFIFTHKKDLEYPQLV